MGQDLENPEMTAFRKQRPWLYPENEGNAQNTFQQRENAWHTANKYGNHGSSRRGFLAQLTDIALYPNSVTGSGSDPFQLREGLFKRGN